MRAKGDTIQSIADVLDKPYTTVNRAVSDVNLLSKTDNKNPTRKRAPGGGRKPAKKNDEALIAAAAARAQQTGFS